MVAAGAAREVLRDSSAIYLVAYAIYALMADAKAETAEASQVVAQGVLVLVAGAVAAVDVRAAASTDKFSHDLI